MRTDIDKWKFWVWMPSPEPNMVEMDFEALQRAFKDAEHLVLWDGYVERLRRDGGVLSRIYAVIQLAHPPATPEHTPQIYQQIREILLDHLKEIPAETKMAAVEVLGMDKALGPDQEKNYQQQILGLERKIWELQKQVDDLSSKLNEWQVAATAVGIQSPGSMQQAKGMAKAATSALLLEYDTTSPNDIDEKITSLMHLRDKLQDALEEMNDE